MALSHWGAILIFVGLILVVAALIWYYASGQKQSGGMAALLWIGVGMIVLGLILFVISWFTRPAAVVVTPGAVVTPNMMQPQANQLFYSPQNGQYYNVTSTGQYVQTCPPGHQMGYAAAAPTVQPQQAVVYQQQPQQQVVYQQQPQQQVVYQQQQQQPVVTVTTLPAAR